MEREREEGRLTIVEECRWLGGRQAAGREREKDGECRNGIGKERSGVCVLLLLLVVGKGREEFGSLSYLAVCVPRSCHTVRLPIH